MIIKQNLQVQRDCSKYRNTANEVDFSASEQREPFDEAVAELAKKIKEIPLYK
jgi:hypothetical protein